MHLINEARLLLPDYTWWGATLLMNDAVSSYMESGIGGYLVCLTKPLDGPPIDGHTVNTEERLMQIRAPLIAHPQPLKTIEPTEGPLNLTQPFAQFDPTPGNA